MQGVVISVELRSRLLAEAAASPQAEICGLLFGSESRIASAQATRNVAQNLSIHFEIDPEQLIAAHKAQRAGGPRVIGCYHSHPTGRPEPSATDLESAEPGSLWLICTADEMRLWRAGETAFEEVNLIFASLAPKSLHVQKELQLLPPGRLRVTDPLLDFASLLCSRLCHDLLSPVGAINNGLELLVDENDPALRRQYMDLLADSARVSADKLKFYRLAFGAAGGFGDRIAASEVRTALEALVKSNSKIAFGWMVDGEEVPRGATRILLNLGLIANDALIRGGRLDIFLEDGEIVVRAEGPRLVLDAEVRAMLEGGDAAPTSRTAGAALARMLAERDGRKLMLSHEEGLLILGASGPVAEPLAMEIAES